MTADAHTSTSQPTLDSTGVTREGALWHVRRETREAVVTAALDPRGWREPRLATGVAFFDHMLEMLGWHADLTLDAAYEARTIRLQHVVAEDVGLAVGATVAAIVRAGIPAGIESAGHAAAVMDEATATSFLSFEGRSLALVHRGGASALERVEDMLCVDLAAFFDGFSQGGRCTVHLRLDDGSRDPHHAWEAGFRAFGRALRATLAPNPARAGRTAGVKGVLD